MEKKEMSTQPKVAAKMVELQMEHNLPVNIIIGKMNDGLKEVALEYDLIDYYAMAWIVNKAVEWYSKLPLEEMDDND